MYCYPKLTAFATALFCFTLSLSLTGQAPVKYSKDVEKRIQSVENNLSGWIITQEDKPFNILDRMKFYNIPGVSIAVINNHKVEWVKGYGMADKERNTPVTPQTLFQAASISKSVNAMGILKLAQDGKLDLNADINDYLRSWRFPYDSLSKGKKIIASQLLSHSAGLSVHGFRGYSTSESVPTLLQVLDGKAPANSAAVRSMFEPGIRSQYSGGGITISQLLVTDITNEAYSDYMFTKVLKPLGMTESSFSQPYAGKAPLAVGYRGDGNEVAGKFHIYPEQAPAGLWTSPAELSKFILELQMSLQGKSNKVLSQPMARLMVKPVVDSMVALGVFVEQKGDNKYFQHGGANEGYRCQYFGSIEGGRGVVVMVNSDNGAILQEIVNSVAVAYNWEGFYKPVVKQVVKVSDDVLSTYVGKYEITPQFVITVSKNGGQLMAQATGQPPLELFAEAENKFFLKVVDAQIEFVKGEDGKISKSVLYQNGRTNDAKRVN
jgi:CubicO group peptidase (beta-lactamase class C family)